jgi:hypothetical protein
MMQGVALAKLIKGGTIMAVRRILRWQLAIVVLLVLVSCNRRDNSQEMAETVILPASEVHDGWYFAAGSKVIIEGTVNGDVYAAGGAVEISGTVNGDLLVAGGDVTVNGTISDDIRAAGGSVRIDGKVGKNVTVAGGNVSLGRKAEVSGGVLAFAGNVQVSGSMARDLIAYAGTAAVSGTVGRDVNFHGGEFATLPGAKVAGDAKICLEDESRLKIAQGTVSGKVSFEKFVGKQRPTILGHSPGMFCFKILWTVWLFLTGLILFALFRKVFDKYCAVLRQRTLSTVLWGIAGIVVLPIATVILAITIVGIPFAILLIELCFWLAYLSQLSTALLVGDLIFRNRESGGWAPLWSFTVGLLIVQALTFIPIVGWLIVIIGFVLGFGALMLLIGEGYKSWRGSQSA